jgi:hypothetical protein
MRPRQGSHDLVDPKTLQSVSPRFTKHRHWDFKQAASLVSSY